MKKNILLFVCLFVSLVSTAQVYINKDRLIQKDIEDSKLCGGIDSVTARKGRWKKADEDIVLPDKTFPRSQYKYIHARLDSIYSLMKETFRRLDGFEPKWHRSIRGTPYIPNGPVPYAFDIYFMEYYCNTNVRKIMLGDETGTIVYIFINHLQRFLEKADTLDINGDGKIKTVFRLPSKTGKWNGMTVYDVRGAQFSTSHAIVIGRKGKLPWRTLTQKQYLTGLKNKWENQLQTLRAGSGFAKDNEQKLRIINDYLASATEETLQQPAIIDPKAGTWGFKGKFGDEDAGGFRLVLLTASDKYFDTSLPRYMPQLIQLYWSYSYSPIGLDINKQLLENFPLEKLKAMIDK